jgi:hypothetical protein
MGRKDATGGGSAAVGARAPAGWPRLDGKQTAIAVLVVLLLAVVVFAVTREITRTAARPATPVAATSPTRPPRPAFTAAEEAYIRALWPIHGDVERSTARMVLGQIFYKINDMDRNTLKGRVTDALATYQRSEGRLRELQPPATVERDHEEYLAAIRLFQQSAVEVLKMFDDGRDDHLVTAYPLGQKATDKIREVGTKFWPHEFPPH